MKSALTVWEDVRIDVAQQQLPGETPGGTLGGRNRAIVIAESLAFVGTHISPENTGFGPHRPCVRCAAIRITRLAFIGVAFHVELRNGLRELTAFAN